MRQRDYRKFIITLFVLQALVFCCSEAAQPSKDSESLLIFPDNFSGKNPKVESISMIIQQGARPRFSPDENFIVFDRKNADGYYDLYMADFNGNIVSSLTENNPYINQKNNGNGVFHPSGRYIIFISEENNHLQDNVKYLADPGVGLYCNLWAMELSTKKAWKLTTNKIKTTVYDRKPAIAVVNPHFSPDGKTLLWTERYAKGGSWGKWRIKAAYFSVKNGRPMLKRETIVFTPNKGNYVTLMGFPGPHKLLLAGNLDGQHEYGMDEYVYDIPSKKLVNLTNSPDTWEEDANVTSDGHIIYMSNKDSKYKYDFGNPSWPSQPMERDYYIMNLDGSNKERLTYFNDPSAPEYLGKRVITVASDVNADAKLLAATLGVDSGDTKRETVLKIALIKLNLE